MLERLPDGCLGIAGDFCHLSELTAVLHPHFAARGERAWSCCRRSPTAAPVQHRGDYALADLAALQLLQVLRLQVECHARRLLDLSDDDGVAQPCF